MALPLKHSCSTDRALEMRVRDALDGLQELACVSASFSAQQVMPEGLEILSIEPPPKEDPIVNSTRATIHSLPLKNKPNEQTDTGKRTMPQEKPG